MNAIQVQFLVFDGCPLAEAARKELDAAVSEAGLAEYEQIDILDPETPEDLRGWGSPTILVNGADVTGSTMGEGVGCRVYATESRVPETALILDRIRKAQPS